MKCRIKIEWGSGVLWDQEFQVSGPAEAFKAAQSAWLVYAETSHGQLRCTIDLEVQ